MTDHDFSDPLSYLSAIEMAWLAADSTRVRCPYGCNVEAHVLPMTGVAWGLDETHEITCPMHEDYEQV
jgi:hypothetical protein